jgi:hypothetical protein
MSRPGRVAALAPVVVAALVAVVALAPVGCSRWGRAGSRAQFTVVVRGGRQTTFSLDSLARLPFVRVMADGKEQEGPTLSTVLAAAGARDYSGVTVIGRIGRLRLARSSVTADVLLDFTNRATVKLASPHIPKSRWVKDVTRIEVQ